jgi:regulator of sigma E protease
MFTLIIFLAVISVLVFVHELGHFIMAKRAGMKVEEFGFGFPPRLWGRKYKGTLYSINAIPFGGFVRIFGEQGDARREPGSFGHGTFRQKTLVIIAGVVMNFAFAAVLLMAGNFLGLRVGLFDDQMISRAVNKKVEILQVAPGSPAETGGLRPLDEIIGFKVGGTTQVTATPEEVQAYAFSHAGSSVTMAVRRGATDIEVPLKLRSPGVVGEGPIGISLALTGEIRYPWYESLWRGVTTAGNLFIATLAGYYGIFASLFRTGHLSADISGPIGIATLTGQAARIGINYLIQFVAMISVNLAVLNILPFPALDGGRLVLVIAEKIRGRALSHRIEDTINAVGFLILVSLMVAVTVKDIVKFF